MRETNNVHEIGLSLGMSLGEISRFRDPLSRYFEMRHGQAIPKTEHKPAFKRGKQILPAFLKRLPGGPHAAKGRYLGIETISFVDHFVSRPVQECVYKVLNHSREYFE